MPSLRNIAVLSLASTALAQQQIPLLDRVKGFFGQASASVASAVPSAAAAAASAAANIPNPVDAGAAAVASAKVTRIGQDNYTSILAPSSAAAYSDGPEEWIIYIDGGNDTCWGRCANATREWNKATVLLQATANPPNLGYIDCETEQILCNLWTIAPPAIYHMLIPAPLPDQSKPATTVRYRAMNATSVTAKWIAGIHEPKNYEQIPVYEGFFHPFDGFGIKTGLALAWAHTVYWVAKMPQWLPMIAISMFSRLFLGRGRNQPNPRAGAAAGAPAAAAPAR